MPHERIYTLNVQDSVPLEFPWGTIRWLCNSKLVPESQQTFGQVTIRPGERNGEHLHPNCEEILFVLSGECEHYVDGRAVALREGDVIFVPDGASHYAVNTGGTDLVMLISYSSPDRETISR
jgi:quercetin dioxygenase-like cupin family protein